MSPSLQRLPRPAQRSTDSSCQAEGPAQPDCTSSQVPFLPSKKSTQPPGCLLKSVFILPFLMMSVHRGPSPPKSSSFFKVRLKFHRRPQTFPNSCRQHRVTPYHSTHCHLLPDVLPQINRGVSRAGARCALFQYPIPQAHPGAHPREPSNTVSETS